MSAWRLVRLEAWRGVRLEACPQEACPQEGCPPEACLLEGCPQEAEAKISAGGVSPGGLSAWRRVLLEACPPGGLSSWRPVLLEACPPGGLSSWRRVLLEACPTGGLSAGEMTANQRITSLFDPLAETKNTVLEVQLFKEAVYLLLYRVLLILAFCLTSGSPGPLLKERHSCFVSSVHLRCFQISLYLPTSQSHHPHQI